MTNTLNKIMHNGDEYKFPWIANGTTGTTSTVSNIRVWTEWEYGLITPEEWQISIVCEWSTPPSPWQPWVNTVAYYPLSANTNDQLNTYNLTNSWITFGTLGWVTCANFDGTSSASGNFYSYWTWDLTASVWGYPTSNSQGVWWAIYVNYLIMNSKNGYVEWTSAPTPLNTWTNIVFTITWGKLKIYSNGTLYLDTSFSNNLPWDLSLWVSNNTTYLNWGLSELIFESVARTAQEVSDYFNQTKANYWIS